MDHSSFYASKFSASHCDGVTGTRLCQWGVLARALALQRTLANGSTLGSTLKRHYSVFVLGTNMAFFPLKNVGSGFHCLSSFLFLSSVT